MVFANEVLVKNEDITPMLNTGDTPCQTLLFSFQELKDSLITPLPYPDFGQG